MDNFFEKKENYQYKNYRLYSNVSTSDSVEQM